MAGLAQMAEFKLESRIFFWSAIVGIVLLFPNYFAPVPHPWLLTHVGFVGVALVFQGVFLIIARDPLRFHPLMLVGVMEKVAFGVPAVAFAAAGKVDPVIAFFGLIDLAMGTMFFWAWIRLRNRS